METHPPPTLKASDTLTIISRKDHTFPECHGQFENGTKCKYREFRCSNYEMKICCNSSCRYEYFLTRYNIRTRLHQHSKFFIESMQDEYSTSRISDKTSITRSKTYVEFYTKDTHLDDRDTVADCMMKCSVEVMRSFNCSFLNKLTLNDPLSLNCYVKERERISSLRSTYSSVCNKKCSNSKREYFWRFIRDTGMTNRGLMEIRVENTIIRTLFAIESYNFVQFISDVGGSAGFFLNVAIMPVVITLSSYVVRVIFVGERSSKKLEKLGKFFKFLLFLSISFLFIRDLNQTIDRNVGKYVGFKSKPCYEGIDCVNPATAYDWIASIFAQVSLGCIPLRTSKRDECLYSCALKHVATQTKNPDKWRVPEVATCSVKQEQKIISLKFALEGHALELLNASDIVKACEKECSQESNVSIQTEVSFHPYVGGIKFNSVSDILCLFYGLVGFYFGFSLLDIGIVFKIPDTKWIKESKHFAALFQMISVLTAVFLGCLLITQRLHKFNCQKVIFKIATIDDNSAVQKLSLTICLTMDPNQSYKRSHNYSTISISSTFNSFECQDNSGVNEISTPKDIMKQSGCMSCKANNFENTKLSLCFSGHVNSTLLPELYALGFIHFEEEEILWDGNIDSESNVALPSLTIENIHIFKPLNSDGLDYYSVCYTKCLNISINFWRSNQTLDVNPYSYVVDPGFLLDKEDCMRRCGSNPFRFITGVGLGKGYTKEKVGLKDYIVRKFSLRPGKIFNACILNNPDASVNQIEDVENYTFSQLMSDIFGITGFCFGVSVLMIWKKLFAIFAYKENNTKIIDDINPASKEILSG